MCSRCSKLSIERYGEAKTALAIDAAVAGQGLTVASRFLVEEDIKAGRLVQAFAATMRGGLDYYVVTLRKPRQPKPTDIVREWLLAPK
jgi:LysR family glycine cleavage system transcriptional activator